MRSRAALLALVLSLLTLAAQFAVRVQMTGALGAGRAYDFFLLLMIPATLVAQVGYQALASAALPRVSDRLAAGDGAGARVLFGRVVWMGNALGAVGCVVGASIFASRFEGAADIALGVMILAAWGIVGGWTVLERQLLVFHERLVWAAVVTMLTPATMAGYGALAGEATLQGFVVAGLGASVAALLIALVLNGARWRAVCATSSNASHEAVAVLPIVLAASPIVMASFNAQAMAAIDQAMAAWWQVGGLTLLATALAVGRLPHTVAESICSSLWYRRLLESVSACRSDQTGAGERLRAVFRGMVLAQALIVVPAALFVELSAESIVSLLFERGSFTAADAESAAAILRWVPVASAGLLLQSVQVQVLVAWGAAARALRLEIVLTILSAVLNIVFLPVMGLPGLLASTALAMSAVALLMFRILRRTTHHLTWFDLGQPFAALVGPALLATLAGLALRAALPHFTQQPASILVSGPVIALVFYASYALSRHDWRARMAPWLVPQRAA